MSTFRILLILSIIGITSVTVIYFQQTALFVLNSLAYFGQYQQYKDINYNNHQQKLDIYITSSNNLDEYSKKPTVIFFYGGCWGACSQLDKTDYRFIAQTLTKYGISTVIVDYRKFPQVKFPSIIADAANSVEWVTNNISRYGGNPQNIYLMGHSAGAHIASILNFNKTYLTEATYRNIKGFIGLAGAYDFLPFDESYQPALFGPPEKYYNSQTINFVTGNEPASLLLYGNNDTRVKRRNIESLSKKINKMEGVVETHIYNNVDHISIISSLSIPFRNKKPILGDILKFINKTSL